LDEGVPLEELSSSSPCATDLSLHLYLSCGSPKGCIGERSTPPLHVVVLQEFQI
jgi:hypothetical protein